MGPSHGLLCCIKDGPKGILCTAGIAADGRTMVVGWEGHVAAWWLNIPRLLYYYCVCVACVCWSERLFERRRLECVSVVDGAFGCFPPPKDRDREAA